MPNWVYTSMSVAGKREDLLAFAEKAKQPHTSQWVQESKTWDETTKSWHTIPENERVIKEELVEPTALSFWNFVRPTDEELPYYFGQKTKPEDEDNPEATSEERFAKAMSFSKSDWYDWNVRNWGTKWDANDDELDSDLDELKEHDSLSYRFSTAWGIPEPIFTAMVEQHPELDFDFDSEEEQGWGAKYTSSDADDVDEGGKPTKSLIMTEEWDIPSSHADYADRGRECWACDSGDPEDLYEDCPDKDKEYKVIVQQVYLVKATNGEDAKHLIATNSTPPTFQSPDLEKAHFVEEQVWAINTGESDFDEDETESESEK